MTRVASKNNQLSISFYKQYVNFLSRLIFISKRWLVVMHLGENRAPSPQGAVDM